MEPAIRTQGLTRDFGSLRAVDHLDLEVRRGALFGFLGPNGAGKTTTIRLLLGLIHPTDGRAWVLGNELPAQADQARMRCGALLEHTGLYERLSAADNLEFYGRVWRMTSNERRGRSRELLTRFGLWERRGETVGSWSRGMKQKLAIARALLNRPEVLFLDEPTSGLDPVAAAALHEDLLGLAGGDGVTIFLTTHNLAEAEKLCDEVAVIRQGRLAAVGAPAELRARSGAPRVEISGHGFTGIMIDQLRARPEVARVELSEGGLKIELRQAGDAAPLVALLAASGAQIEEVRKGAPSLEEAFLDLVEEKS